MKEQQCAGTEGMLNIPPAVCDILGRAVHFSSRESVFSQYGLTGCREMMEGLVKQALMGSCTSMHVCFCKLMVHQCYLSNSASLDINIF